MKSRILWALAIAALADLIHCTYGPSQDHKIDPNGHSLQTNESSAHIKTDRNRDPYHWSKIYFNEYHGHYFEVNNVEDSLDERLANMIHTQEVYRIAERDGNIVDIDYNDKHAAAEIAAEYERYINGPEVDEKLCNKHLKSMVSLLDELESINESKRHRLHNGTGFDERHIHLARVLDSFGRYRSGMLDGRSRSFGSSRECLETKLIFSNGIEGQKEAVKTRSCIVRLRIDDHLSPKINPKLSTHLNKLLDTIQVGVCLPNTCHSNSLAKNRQLIQRLVDSQFSLPESIYVQKHRKIADLFCTNEANESPSLPTSGRVLITLIMVWLAVILITTMHSDIMSASSSAVDRTMSRYMDLKKILQEFVGLAETSNRYKRVDLDALNIVKFMAVSTVITIHSQVFYINFTDTVHRDYANFHKSAWFAWIYGLNLNVDTFFVISGILVTFTTLTKLKPVDESTWWNLARFYCKQTASRYLRFVPLYVLMFWFQKSIYIYYTIGLQADQGFNRNTFIGGCKYNPWYLPLTPLASTIPLDRQCLPQTWSVGSDIVFALIGVPFMLALYKKPKLFIPLVSIGALSCTVTMYNALFRVDPYEFKLFEDLTGYTIFSNARNDIIYTSVHYRIGPLMIGMLAGFTLFCYETGVIKEWPSWLEGRISRIASVATVMMVLSGASAPLLYQYVFPYVPIKHMLFFHQYATIRWIYSHTCAVVFIMLVTNWRHSLFVKLLNGNLLRVMSKMNFAILLIHIDIVFYILLSTPYGPDFMQITVLHVAAAVFLYTIVLASMVYILIEAPLGGIIGAMLNSKTSVYDLMRSNKTELSSANAIKNHKGKSD